MDPKVVNLKDLSVKDLLSIQQVLQEFHQQLFVQRNPTFHKATDFLFQPSDSDTVSPPPEGPY